MGENIEGYKIIELLNSTLDTERSLEDIQFLYEIATTKMSNDSDTAIRLCKQALKILQEASSKIKGDLVIPYTRGKFHLLLASIYLNENRNLELAKKHYFESRDAFSSRKWFHLEGLAYLGLTITWRKLANLDEALEATYRAQNIIEQEAMPENIDTHDLEEAIKEERRMIETLLFPDKLPAEQERKTTEKRLLVFHISAGDRLIAAGGTTDLNLFSSEDYEQGTSSRAEEVVLDLTKHPNAQSADYILEIDKNINGANGGLAKGDWLLIRSETNAAKLNGRTVAVLVRDETKIFASLKTFSKADDHYFLRAQSKNVPSIVVTHYKSGDIAKIESYYSGDEPVDIRRAYEVRVTGEVIGRIPQASIKNVAKGFVWLLPVVSNIAAGLGVITEENVEEYVSLEKDKYGDADFGVRVVGDSMSRDGIFAGDIALIRQQPTVKQGDIAAIVILTPEMESLGVLKRLHVSEGKRDNLRHWFLRSSNPQSEHLVVMPAGIDEKEVERIYTRQIEAGKLPNQVKFYRDAELVIAGKLVGVVREKDISIVRN